VLEAEVAAQGGACEVMIGRVRSGTLALISGKYIVTFSPYQGKNTILLGTTGKSNGSSMM
jgi:hypothetical protein